MTYEQVLNARFGAKGGELLATGSYQDVHSKKAKLGSPTTFWEVSWGAAEVEVDPDTGAVKLTKYVSVADLGKAIHPLQCEGQDEGAVMFAIGHSLMEEMRYEDGHLLNPNLVDYRLPSFKSMPDSFVTIMLENGNGPGPYGSKGLGEGGLMPVAPAIGNAIEDATGVRMHELPITPERLWRALQKD
jgi:CO/xanthine dehydrogenase Mo-binding subunit